MKNLHAMKARQQLTDQEYQSVKSSFINIYILFLKEEPITTHLVDCLLKWGIQLDLNEQELNGMIKQRENFDFQMPTRQEAIEQIYDLVYMIYMDEVVEDAELQIATKYAEKLGFESHVVGDLLKAIVAAPGDGLDHHELKSEIKKLLLQD